MKTKKARKRRAKGPVTDTAQKDPAVAKAMAEDRVNYDRKKQIEKYTALLGRPRVYKVEFCGMLVDHMAKGMSFETFGALDEVFVGRSTLYKWLGEYPEFMDAKELGMEKCRQWWESLGNRYSVNNLRGSGESINASVYKINMQNRFGWMEKQAVADGGKVNLHDEIMGDIHGDKDEDGEEE